MVNLLSVVRTIWMFNIDKVQHWLNRLPNKKKKHWVNQSVASSRSLEFVIWRIHWCVKIPQKMKIFL